jgi:effector-binding domain-containing protein
MLDQQISAEQLDGMLRLRQAELQSQIAADTSRLAQVEARLRIIEMEGVMPADDIQVKRIPAVRVAELTAIAASLEPASISPVIQPLYPELGCRLGGAGLTPVGPAIAYYQDAPDGDGVIVHAALPVNADPGTGRGFEITDLPEISQAATIVHRGSMDNVMATFQALARWMEDNGYRSAGYARELYLECPRAIRTSGSPNCRNRSPPADSAPALKGSRYADWRPLPAAGRPLIGTRAPGNPARTAPRAVPTRAPASRCRAGCGSAGHSPCRSRR